MAEIARIAVLGAGVIGASWASLFAAEGLEVSLYDPAPDSRERVLRFVETAAPVLAALGKPFAGQSDRLRFCADPAEAVENADFVQENLPERLELKHAAYARIEPVLAPGAIIGSSTSGLKLSAMQAGLRDPGQLIIAHPFNPPHLIPLVELLGNAQTAPGVLDRAQAFYEGIGKVCIRLNKEATGHVANRLQAALWREAIHLAVEGVASVGDIDKAIAHGPGLRWAVMGPSTLFHLAGGPGGMQGFCDHLGEPMESWWAALGSPHLTPEVVETLVAGVNAAVAGESLAELATRRDRAILAMLLAQKDS